MNLYINPAFALLQIKKIKEEKKRRKKKEKKENGRSEIEEKWDDDDHGDNVYLYVHGCGGRHYAL